VASYDYTKGKLNELVDIIIDSGAKLFGKPVSNELLYLLTSDQRTL
jgi:hypothetical protein